MQLVLDVAAVRAGIVDAAGRRAVVVLDPIGGPIAVALAEELGERAILVTQDNIAGNELSRTGRPGAGQRPAPAARRAHRAPDDRSGRPPVARTARPRGRPRGRASRIASAASGAIIAAAAVVDCGFRLPDEPLPGVARPSGRLRGAPHDPRGHPGRTAGAIALAARHADRPWVCALLQRGHTT